MKIIDFKDCFINLADFVGSKKAKRIFRKIESLIKEEKYYGAKVVYQIAGIASPKEFDFEDELDEMTERVIRIICVCMYTENELKSTEILEENKMEIWDEAGAYLKYRYELFTRLAQEFVIMDFDEFYDETFR